MEAIVEKSQYEIERGKPMPSKNHAYIQHRIGKLIDRKYLDEFLPLPELTLDINGSDKIPDLAIYKEIDYTPGLDEIRVSQMPLGVIEILSPKQHIADLIIKSNDYFDAGILSYWLVLPDLKSIYVYSGKGEYEVYAKTNLLKDTQLGIELDLAELFKEKKKNVL